MAISVAVLLQIHKGISLPKVIEVNKVIAKMKTVHLFPPL